MKWAEDEDTVDPDTVGSLLSTCFQLKCYVLYINMQFYVLSRWLRDNIRSVVISYFNTEIYMLGKKMQKIYRIFSLLALSVLIWYLLWNSGQYYWHGSFSNLTDGWVNLCWMLSHHYGCIIHVALVVRFYLYRSYRTT